MLRRNTVVITVLTLALLLTSPVFAQRMLDRAPCGQGHGPGFGPGMPEMIEKLNLSDQQQEQLQDMRLANQKEMIPLRADIKLLRLELQELISNDASRSEIDNKIDQISEARKAIQKKRVGHRLDMRQVLTPEQRKQWDKMKHHRGMKGEHHGARGHHGQGKGMGRGI